MLRIFRSLFAALIIFTMALSSFAQQLPPQLLEALKGVGLSEEQIGGLVQALPSVQGDPAKISQLFLQAGLLPSRVETFLNDPKIGAVAAGLLGIDADGVSSVVQEFDKAYAEDLVNNRGITPENISAVLEGGSLEEMKEIAESLGICECDVINALNLAAKTSNPDLIGDLAEYGREDLYTALATAYPSEAILEYYNLTDENFTNALSAFVNGDEEALAGILGGAGMSSKDFLDAVNVLEFSDPELLDSYLEESGADYDAFLELFFEADSEAYGDYDAEGDDAGGEGDDTGAEGDDAGAEGDDTGAEGDDAGAEGDDAGAEGDDAGAEGDDADGDDS